MQALQQGVKNTKQDIGAEAMEEDNDFAITGDRVKDDDKEIPDEDSDLGGELTLESKRIGKSTIIFTFLPSKITGLIFFMSLDKLINSLQNLMIEEPDITNEELVTYLQDNKAKFNLTEEALPYIALCGVFSPRRHIVKYWDLN